MDLPFISRLESFGRALVSLLMMPWLQKYVVGPFVVVITFLARFKIDLELLNITCSGSTAPVKLLTNICVVGIIFIVVEAEFPFLNSVTLRSLSNKFYRIVGTPSYFPWSPHNYMRLSSQIAVSESEGRGADTRVLGGIARGLSKCYHYFRSFFPPTAIFFSFHYFGVLFLSLISVVVQSFDVFQTALQYLASRVILVDFLDYNYVMHSWDPSCNNVKGFPYFDTVMAVVTSICFWLLLLPSFYLVSEILIRVLSG